MLPIASVLATLKFIPTNCGKLKTMTVRRCDCCERECPWPENKLRIQGFGAWLIGIDQDLCYDCYACWYDGKVDPAKIKATVLEAESLKISIYDMLHQEALNGKER